MPETRLHRHDRAEQKGDVRRCCPKGGRTDPNSHWRAIDCPARIELSRCWLYAPGVLRLVFRWSIPRVSDGERVAVRRRSPPPEVCRQRNKREKATEARRRGFLIGTRMRVHKWRFLLAPGRRKEFCHRPTM